MLKIRLISDKMACKKPAEAFPVTHFNKSIAAFMLPAGPEQQLYFSAPI